MLHPIESKYVTGVTPIISNNSHHFTGSIPSPFSPMGFSPFSILWPFRTSSYQVSSIYQGFSMPFSIGLPMEFPHSHGKSPSDPQLQGLRPPPGVLASGLRKGGKGPTPGSSWGETVGFFHVYIYYIYICYYIIYIYIYFTLYYIYIFILYYIILYYILL